MNKRENVIAMVRGEKAEFVPASFWLHFRDFSGETVRKIHVGDESARTHQDFFKRTNMAMGKVMGDNPFPQDLSLTTAAAWDHFKGVDVNSQFIKDQLDLVKRVVDIMDGEICLLATVQGAVTSWANTLGGLPLYGRNKQLLAEHLRANPTGVKAGIRAIGDTLCYIAEKCIEAGADGIYYAGLAGENYLLTDEEFAEFIRPVDISIFEAAGKKPAFNVLHMCNDKLNLERFSGYPVEVVNWGNHLEGNAPLTAAKDIFPGCAVLGGLDNKVGGALVSGTDDEIRAEVKKAIDEMGTTKFLIGADCTVPSDISYDRLRCAVDAAAAYKF